MKVKNIVFPKLLTFSFQQTKEILNLFQILFSQLIKNLNIKDIKIAKYNLNNDLYNKNLESEKFLKSKENRNKLLASLIILEEMKNFNKIDEEFKILNNKPSVLKMASDFNIDSVLFFMFKISKSGKKIENNPIEKKENISSWKKIPFKNENGFLNPDAKNKNIDLNKEKFSTLMNEKIFQGSYNILQFKNSEKKIILGLKFPKEVKKEIKETNINKNLSNEGKIYKNKYLEIANEKLKIDNIKEIPQQRFIGLKKSLYIIYNLTKNNNKNDKLSNIQNPKEILSNNTNQTTQFLLNHSSKLSINQFKSINQSEIKSLHLKDFQFFNENENKLKKIFRENCEFVYDKKIEKSFHSEFVIFVNKSGVNDIHYIRNLNKNLDFNKTDLNNLSQFIKNMVLEIHPEGEKRAFVKLEPPELGSLDVKIDLHQDQVKIIIKVEKPEIIQDLKHHYLQIKTGLEEAGLHLKEFYIFIGGDMEGQQFTKYFNKEQRYFKNYPPRNSLKAINHNSYNKSLISKLVNMNGTYYYIA